MSKLHGLRHAYAQQRYFELTGWKTPVAGGPTSDSLTTDQRALDSKARAMISCELGHARKPSQRCVSVDENSKRIDCLAAAPGAIS